MILRKDQIQELEQRGRQEFVDWVVEHLSCCFPEEYAARGGPAVRKAVDLGIERVQGYGIHSAPDIVGTINLMFAIHDDFDRDPRIPWAAQILCQETLSAAAKLTSINAYVEMECPDKGEASPSPPEET